MGESRFATISAAVLTGGASTRMGHDKARMEVGGAASATLLARLLDGLFEDLLLVGGSPPDDAPGRRVPDPDGPVCALRGLVAALDAARGPRVLVVATDLPLLTPDLVLALVAFPEADAVVPRSERSLHPLCALYRRGAVLPAARERLAAGDLALRGLLDAVDTALLSPEDLALVDPAGLALTNVNTPEELREARSLLDPPHRSP
ncbi:MAG: molybdenum cofactor guanylyltransferase [Myxococcota bacterium]|nr:molybdenum cofactor guanylyltransferase [Myxococcota bacterium]